MFHVEHTSEELLREHLAWVLATNKTHNLTAITEEDEAWRLHVIDSLAILPEVQSAPEGPLLDIGSGGGFPGVPLAIMSARETVCLDSVKKKSDALVEFLRGKKELLHLCASNERAEELALQLPGYFAVVVTRAVGQLASIVGLAGPLLMMDGVCLCMKANLSDEEIEAGDIAAQRCGLAQQRIRNYTLEGGTENRCVVEYKKVSHSQISLPRRTGVAQKRPLA
jgi:16S rRNA (guanine527-N7)-methyltransferase